MKAGVYLCKESIRSRVLASNRALVCIVITHDDDDQFTPSLLISDGDSVLMALLMLRRGEWG